MEEVFENLESPLIDLVVSMHLKSLDVLEPSVILKLQGKSVLLTERSEVGLSRLQNVFEAFEGDREHSGLSHFESLNEGLDNSFLHEGSELSESGTCGSVADCPHSFLLDLVIIKLKDLDELVNDAHVETLLNLLSGSCGDV